MPSYYRVWCRFEPDHVYEITGRKGQWRVKLCIREWDIKNVRPGDFCLLHAEKNFPDVYLFKGSVDYALTIRSTKRYRHGCIIRPHKELNRVLQQRKAQHGIQPVQNV